MAIAGSGGWVPSCRVIKRNGGLVATGKVKDVPPDLVYSDENNRAYGTLADAVVRLKRGESILCDMCNGQYLRLLEMWKGQEVGGEDHGEG